MLVKKNIVIDDKMWKELKLFAELHKDMSVSNIIRESVALFLEDKQENDIAFKMRLATEEVDEIEQEEIENRLKKLTKDDLATAETIKL